MSAYGFKRRARADVPTPAVGEFYEFIDSANDHKTRKYSDGSFVDLDAASTGVSSFEGRTGIVTAQTGDYDTAQISHTPSGGMSSTNGEDAINELNTSKAPASHVGSGGVSEHAVATGAAAGFMSPSDKTKLDGISAGADVSPVTSVAGKTGVVTLVKGDVGLGNVDNTSDANKPVSTAQAAADAAILAAAEAYADGVGASIVDAAPAALDTLNELAAALGDDANFAATTATAIGNRLRVDTDSQGLSSGEKLNAKTNIDLQNVNNTSDANKPVSTAQATAIGLKANKAGDTFTGEVVVEGDMNGTGTVNLKSQNTDPSTPASGVRTFADVNEMFAFKGQSGFKAVLNDQNMTADRQFDLPDNDGPLMADPMTAAGSMIRRNALNQNVDLPIGAEDEILRVVSGIPEWVEENLSQDIGGGGDGNVTLNGAFTAPDILYYNQLNIDAGTVFNPDAYIIYAKKLNLTNAPAGAITRSGNNGGNSANNTGAAGGAAFTARVLATNAAGGTGAAGQTNNGVQGAAGGAISVGNGGNGGASGLSGAGGTGIAANAIAGGAVTTRTHLGRFEYQFIRGVTQISGGAGGRGGNSGGGDGAAGSRGGGGGGAGGAVLVLICGEIVTGPSTPAGVIVSRGGNGGVQTSAPASGNVGGSSGGGGGGGGYIYVAYVKKTGAPVVDLIDASGGNGGNGSNGLGTGLGANGSQGGDGGRIQLFNITEGMGTLIVGSTGSNGTAGSGTTGGTGGQGGACKATL